ncbi:uncharacterized protein LAESUDRAFT_715138 [Laetiporus sulphureus 93-53]|uniref:HTH CENPB-type domain-containing protein n=1 Tax=Laetiporus sulphureus 93-53 TaxID=1314785 RepID=A0A165DKQ4_9APHY|nr:uncharacterized protein LAESUDRAFT_715138 [Laetiporus sulphureus 93-53]KZT05097.1 hypothetical protein LAESUDRAFT_715138 [Laetiporus sulphureus 93-53]
MADSTRSSATQSNWPSNLGQSDAGSGGGLARSLMVARRSMRSGSGTSTGSSRPVFRRNHITTIDRKALCELHEKDPTLTHKELGELYGIKRSTVTKLLKHKKRWLESTQFPTYKAKRKSSIKFDYVENKLNRWLVKEAADIELTDAFLREHARRLAEDSGRMGKDMRFSNDWLQGFKDRYGIRRKHMYINTKKPRKIKAQAFNLLYALGLPSNYKPRYVTIRNEKDVLAELPDTLPPMDPEPGEDPSARSSEAASSTSTSAAESTQPSGSTPPSATAGTSTASLTSAVITASENTGRESGANTTTQSSSSDHNPATACTIAEADKIMNRLMRFFDANGGMITEAQRESFGSMAAALQAKESEMVTSSSRAPAAL